MTKYTDREFEIADRKIARAAATIERVVATLLTATQAVAREQ
jgi:hypothetical protein